MEKNEEPNVFLEGKNVIELTVYDPHQGKTLVKNALIDHVEIENGKLKVEINSEVK